MTEESREKVILLALSLDEIELLRLAVSSMAGETLAGREDLERCREGLVARLPVAMKVESQSPAVSSDVEAGRR